MPASVEIIAGQLVWAPELNQRSEDIMDVLLLSSDDGHPATYDVQHYSPEATGAAFGPLGLDHTLRFCCRLSAILACRTCKQPPLTLTSSPGDAKAHTNACVLVGAYLVLVQQWSAMQVVEIIGYKEAERKFPCSWARPDCPEAQWVMPVRFCLEGLQIAFQNGWIGQEQWKEEACMTAFCSQYRHLSIAYDSSWIVPEKLMISADPITTACDPNPETFSDVWYSANDSEPPTPERLRSTAAQEIAMDPSPKNKKDPAETKVRFFSENIDLDLYCQGKIDLYDAQCETQSSPSTPTKSGADISASIRSWACSNVSVETACKAYVGVERVDSLRSMSSNKSLVANLRDCGVTCIIRCNYSTEPGMPAASYDEKRWEGFGIKHIDLRFEDVKGGLPRRSTIASMLKVAGVSADSKGALLVHCKGGFGRSTTLACCWAIYEYDIPGQALLGWVRIARPGAITTAKQEAFLISMTGRAAVARFAGVSGDLASVRAARTVSDAAAVSRRACCTLQ